METTIITGVIQDIEQASASHFPKSIATIRINESESVFVEFRQSVMMNQLNNYKLGDKVSIAVKYEAKMAKNSGIRFNNVFAKSIKKCVQS